MRKIECPSLIIHGTADEEIPIAHAKMLYAAACRPAPPFWVKGAGHNDVVEHSEEEYFRRDWFALRSEEDQLCSAVIGSRARPSIVDNQVVRGLR